METERDRDVGTQELYSRKSILHVNRKVSERRHTKLKSVVTLGETFLLFRSFISLIDYFYNLHFCKLLYNVVRCFLLLLVDQPLNIVQCFPY